MFEYSLAKSILKSAFGLDSFRGLQEPIVRNVAKGRNSLVIMPTGSGKSLCFQVPALAIADRDRVNSARKRTLTLVLSPLVALMKDQVDSLVKMGIDATFINSSLDRRERLQRYQAVANGQSDLLYVTPERFRKADFLDVIARRKIKLLAVDEAHCISEWGHDFRPDYTRVAEVRKRLDDPVTIALTATATPAVQQDIIRQLGLHPDEIDLFHQGIERPNLTLEVMPVWDDDEKLAAILELRRQHPGPGIVYFTLIKSLQQFSDRLLAQKFDHVVYHGELERLQRRRLQEQFMREPDQLVLATNAFGMGIDKENIRFVLHADLPGSLESYYQEIGRAGRDGFPSKCLLLYDERDLATQLEFLRWSNPDSAFYQRLYEILAFETEKVNAFGLEWLRERLHHKRRYDRRLETALAMLERWEVFAGTLDPLQISAIHELPERFSNTALVEAKLKRDQHKLLAMVQYAKHDGDRKQLINQYFGIG